MNIKLRSELSNDKNLFRNNAISKFGLDHLRKSKSLYTRTRQQPIKAEENEKNTRCSKASYPLFALNVRLNSR